MSAQQSAAVLHEIVNRLPYDGDPDAKARLHASVAAAYGEQVDEDFAAEHGLSEAQLADVQDQADKSATAEPAAKKTASSSGGSGKS
jgi:hypothetical protein